jgi:CheY-like chemotaxis protein
VILTFDLEANLWPVSADEGQLIQVINNLAVNAVQAMPSGGTLAIAARHVRPDRASATPQRDGRWVEIVGEDTGSGISPENLQKIFEPFFTTKARGTGLGLATCYSIVKKHGGRLSVESQLGVGTRFQIMLPAAMEPKGPAADRQHRDSKGRILVMDDDRQMRETMALMLSLTGYESADAEEGGEALKKFDAARESGRPFDLVFLDIRVPHGMGGRETLAELIKRDPTVRAIASSGHTDDPVMLDFLGNGFVGALPKPFKIDALRSALGTILKR